MKYKILQQDVDDKKKWNTVPGTDLHIKYVEILLKDESIMAISVNIHGVMTNIVRIAP